MADLGQQSLRCFLIVVYESKEFYRNLLPLNEELMILLDLMFLIF